MPIQSDGPFARVELLAKANFLGHLMGEEVPIPVVPGSVRANVGQVWRGGGCSTAPISARRSCRQSRRRPTR
ncbi:MAG: hypothetical protein U0736_19835 [Gemmataceae bacterium]